MYSIVLIVKLIKLVDSVLKICRIYKGKFFE